MAIDVVAKYLIVLGGSFFLWLVPVSLKAPRLIVFMSFVTSISGYAYCFTLAGQVDRELRLKKQNRILRSDVSDYQFTLEEKVQRQQLQLLYFPEKQRAAAPTQPAVTAAAPASLPPDDLIDRLANLPPHLEAILECAIENGGKCTARQAFRFSGIAGKHSADEVKGFFEDLEELELGTIAVDGRTVTFSIAPALAEVS